MSPGKGREEDKKANNDVDCLHERTDNRRTLVLRCVENNYARMMVKSFPSWPLPTSERIAKNSGLSSAMDIDLSQ